MPWQEIMAGLIIVGAGAYVVRRLRGRRSSSASKGGPDVPVSRTEAKTPASELVRALGTVITVN